MVPQNVMSLGKTYNSKVKFQDKRSPKAPAVYTKPSVDRDRGCVAVLALNGTVQVWDIDRPEKAARGVKFRHIKQNNRKDHAVVSVTNYGIIAVGSLKGCVWINTVEQFDSSEWTQLEGSHRHHGRPIQKIQIFKSEEATKIIHCSFSAIVIEEVIPPTGEIGKKVTVPLFNIRETCRSNLKTPQMPQKRDMPQKRGMLPSELLRYRAHSLYRLVVLKGRHGSLGSPVYGIPIKKQEPLQVTFRESFDPAQLGKGPGFFSFQLDPSQHGVTTSTKFDSEPASIETIQMVSEDKQHFLVALVNCKPKSAADSTLALPRLLVKVTLDSREVNIVGATFANMLDITSEGLLLFQRGSDLQLGSTKETYLQKTQKSYHLAAEDDQVQGFVLDIDGSKLAVGGAGSRGEDVYVDIWEKTGSHYIRRLSSHCRDQGSTTNNSGEKVRYSHICGSGTSVYAVRNGDTQKGSALVRLKILEDLRFAIVQDDEDDCDPQWKPMLHNQLNFQGEGDAVEKSSWVIPALKRATPSMGHA